MARIRSHTTRRRRLVRALHCDFAFSVHSRCCADVAESKKRVRALQTMRTVARPFPLPLRRLASDACLLLLTQELLAFLKDRSSRDANIRAASRNVRMRALRVQVLGVPAHCGM